MDEYYGWNVEEFGFGMCDSILFEQGNGVELRYRNEIIADHCDYGNKHNGNGGEFYEPIINYR